MGKGVFLGLVQIADEGAGGADSQLPVPEAESGQLGQVKMVQQGFGGILWLKPGGGLPAQSLRSSESSPVACAYTSLYSDSGSL